MNAQDIRRRKTSGKSTTTTTTRKARQSLTRNYNNADKTLLLVDFIRRVSTNCLLQFIELNAIELKKKRKEKTKTKPTRNRTSGVIMKNNGSIVWWVLKLRLPFSHHFQWVMRLSCCVWTLETRKKHTWTFTDRKSYICCVIYRHLFKCFGLKLGWIGDFYASHIGRKSRNQVKFIGFVKSLGKN